MKTIGIKDFQALVKACLSNPKEFVDKSIILWNALYTQDGIAYRVIKDCCIEYNKMNSNNQVWFQYSDFLFKKDMISTLRACPDIHYVHEDWYGFKTRGILFNTGCFMNDDLNDWLKFITTKDNDSGHLSPDWVLIACAHESSGLNENQFPDNCDIYSIQPSVDEWAKWVVQYNRPTVIEPIRKYIETKKPSIHFDYWNRIMDSLDRALNSEDIESLKQLSEHDFERAVGGVGWIVPGFPYKDLWDFIQSH